MKKLFQIGKFVFFDEGNKQIIMRDDTGLAIRKITVPIAIKDIEFAIKRKLDPSEIVVDPILQETTLAYSSGYFQDTTLRIAYGYRIMHVWKSNLPLI